MKHLVMLNLQHYPQQAKVRPMTRVSVPVSDRIKTEVAEHADDLEFDANLSEAQRYAQLIEEGYAARRAAVLNRRRELAYAEHNEDQEYVQATDLADSWAFSDGGC